MPVSAPKPSANIALKRLTVEAAIETVDTPKEPAIRVLPTLQSSGIKPRFLADRVPRSGYPLYSSILSHTPELQCFRRFGEVRMRILLMKQDDVTLLEQELFEVDRVEKATLFLGSKRLDRNKKRKDILGKLETALADYGKRREISFELIFLPLFYPGCSSWLTQLSQITF
jgi:hypothetical protein